MDFGDLIRAVTGGVKAGGDEAVTAARDTSRQGLFGGMLKLPDRAQSTVDEVGAVSAQFAADATQQGSDFGARIENFFGRGAAVEADVANARAAELAPDPRAAAAPSAPAPTPAPSAPAAAEPPPAVASAPPVQRPVVEAPQVSNPQPASDAASGAAPDPASAATVDASVAGETAGRIEDILLTLRIPRS